MKQQNHKLPKLIAGMADSYRQYSPGLYRRLREYALLMRLNRPIGLFLLGWPALWALWLSADGQPAMDIVVIFVLGVILMRSAGCVINDFADRRIDPQVERTKDRPLAAGRVKPIEALVLFGVLVSAAFGLVLLLNELTLYLSIAALLSATSYPFMKRFTYIPQAFLGIAFAWAIPMAWAAQTNSIPTISWLLFIIVILWAMAYDTMYAMADREDDLKVGVKSTAILFGEADKIVIAAIQFSVLTGLFMLGQQAGLGLAYHSSLFIAALLNVYQQYLIRNRDPSACLAAFLNNNWFGFVIFIGIVADYYI